MGSAPDRGAILTASVLSLIQLKAKQLSRKRGFNRSDHDDLAQELTLRLLEKEHLYDPTRGASLDTFASHVLNSEVCMILRDRRRLKRAAGITAQSLDGTAVTNDRDGRQPVSLAAMVSDSDRQRVTLTSSRPDDNTDHEAVLKALSSLPADSELADIARRLQSGTVTSVAKDLSTTRRQIRNTIEQLRPYFEKAGF